MRKIFLLLGLLVCFSGLSQNPDYHRFGERSKYYQPDTLSTTLRDALTPKLGTILYHKDTGVSRWEQWDGTSWVEFGGGAEYTFSDTAEIDLTLTGDDVTADIVAGSLDETKLDASVNASLDLADSSTQPGDNNSTLTNDSEFINVNVVDSLLQNKRKGVNAIRRIQIEKTKKVAVIGNSITHGAFATSNIHDSYGGILRKSFQKELNTDAFGFQTIKDDYAWNNDMFHEVIARSG